MKSTLLVILALSVLASAANAPTMPDSKVYHLSATKRGELRVHCTNGADATMVPTVEFGTMIVSCGK